MRWSIAWTIGVLAIALASCSAREVDPALVGTWQLQGAPAPVYWDIRADGTYQFYGPGAGAGHSGSFNASAGNWSLHSGSWGDDGGSYQLLDSGTFVGVGRLGPGKWVRAAASAVTTAGAPTGGNLTLALQTDSGQPLPRNIPELLEQATERARQWRADAVPEHIDYRNWDVPNPKMRGPEVRVSFYSPAARTGTWITVRESGAVTSTAGQPVRDGQISLPPVFVDLPVAVRAARKNGMQGAVTAANLRVWKPGGRLVLAWMLSAPGGGRTIDALTGQVLEGDITRYIAQYNAQWENAAAGLRALLRPRRSAAAGAGVEFGTSVPGSDTPYDDGSQARAEYERNAAESRAYWNGSSEDYSRIKNGECSSSDNSRFGC